MGYLTSGNAVVDRVGTINITGNIIPAIWYKTILKSSGKPYLLATAILADIVYWYRPTEIRDRGTGQVSGWKKKFSEDILRQSYQYYADLFGESKKTVKTAMDRLEELGVIKRDFRTVSYGDGLVSNNVMYIELMPDKLYELTYPEEEPGKAGRGKAVPGGDGDRKGGRLPTKPLWKKREGGVSQTGGTCPPYRRQEVTEKYTACIPNRREVIPGTDIHIQRLQQRILTETSTIHPQRKKRGWVDMMTHFPVWSLSGKILNMSTT